MKGNGVVGVVRFEQVGVLATQWPKPLIEEAHQIFSGDRADVEVTGDIAVRPEAKTRAPGTGFHVLDDDA